jgi:hypothetical protein
MRQQWWKHLKVREGGGIKGRLVSNRSRSSRKRRSSDHKILLSQLGHLYRGSIRPSLLSSSTQSLNHTTTQSCPKSTQKLPTTPAKFPSAANPKPIPLLKILETALGTAPLTPIPTLHPIRQVTEETTIVNVIVVIRDLIVGIGDVLDGAVKLC